MISSALLASAFLTTFWHQNNPVLETDSIYNFHMTDIDGKDRDLADFKGKVLLVVNVASRCGHTPQYEALEALYTKHKEEGFAVLGFPSNDFGAQEPGSDAQIKEFCVATYHVTFPMFSKITVTGENTHPLYKWLISKTDRSQEVSWNFEKFLIDREGKVIQRFTPKTKPDSQVVVDAVKHALHTK